MQDIEQDNRSITGVLHGIVGNVEVLVEAQVGLAKAELRELVQDGVRAVVPMWLGVALGQLALGLLLVAAVVGLATRYPLWLAALGVGIVTGVVAMVMIAQGRRQMASIGHSSDRAPARRGGISHG
jgi:uncharacterized membrane protein YqjE